MSFSESAPEDEVILVGDLPFGLDLEKVKEVLEELKGEMAEVQEALSDKNLPEQLKEFARKREPQLETLLSVQPEEILRVSGELYNYVKAKEAAGLSYEDILSQIGAERPDLEQAASKFYPILRTQTWGYRIFQNLYARSLSKS